MSQSRTPSARSSSRNNASKKKTRPSHFVRARPFLEHLEDRIVLSGDGSATGAALWLARFDGLSGNTRDAQMQAAQQVFAASASVPKDVQVVNQVGVPGIVVLQTPQNMDLHTLEADLIALPGFRYVEAYDPGADPASRASQFPIGPRAEDDGGDGGDDAAPSTLAPALPGGPSDPSAPSGVTNINGFDGINSNQNPFALSPPDSTGAVGPNSYIQPVNISLQIFHKDGTPMTPVTTFSNFYSSLGDLRNFSDPVIVYNDITQRFFIGILDYDFSGVSRLDVAISTSSNPTTLTGSDWNFYRYNANDLTTGFDIADYPKLGYDADGYVVTFNEFPDGQYYDHAAVLAIRNDGSTATGNEAVAVPGGFSNFTLAPARTHDTGASSMWFVETPGSTGNYNGSQITVARMDNPFSASPSWTFTNLDVNPYLFQPSPLGNRTGLGTRMYFSALRTTNGVTHLVAADSPGTIDGSGNVHSKVRWYDIDVTNPASPQLFQEGQIDPGPGIDTYFPDADIAPDGSIGLTYSQSLPFYSSDPRAGVMDMYVTGRLPSDPLGTMEPGVVARLGTAQLNAYGRAGDYSFTTVDPSDGSFWAVNEYSAAIFTPNWATWIQHFQLAALRVTSSTPAYGSSVPTSPSSYVINFSEAIDPASLQASDLTVDAHPATGVTLSADHMSATFTFTVNPAANQGLHTLAIAGGSITEDGDPSTVILAYSANFRYDAIPLQVSSTMPPTPNGVFTLPGPLTYDVTFNEPVDPTSVQASDLVLSGMPGATVTGVTVLPGNTTARFTIGGVTSEGTLNTSIQAGTVTDQYGNPGATFSASYTVDYGTIPFPVPLTPVQPLGSLIYDPTQSGTIQFAGDTDNFTLSVDAGQTITLLLTTSASLQGTLNLATGSSTVASATASAAGQNVVIQTLKVPGQLGGSTPATNYTITVGGAGGTLGSYTLEVILNAALENESVGSTSDDTTATAQDLTNSFVLLNSAGTTGTQPGRAAVLGSLRGNAEATVPNSLENFDTNWGNAFPFVLQPFGLSSMRYQQIYSASQMEGGGLIDQVRLRRAIFAAPFADFQADVTVRIGYAAQSFAHASSHFDSNLGAGVITAFDGPLTIRGDGSGAATNPFNVVINLTSDFNYDPTKGDLVVEFDVHSSAADFATYFSSTDPNGFYPTTRVWYPSDTSTDGYVNDGYGLVTQFGYVPDSADTYKITLNSGQTATVAATGLSGSAVQVALLDSHGNTLALGSAGQVANFSSLISNFAAPSSGTYYVQVTSGGNGQYSLVVTRSAGLDTENNGSTATAQDLVSPQVAGQQWALGHVQGGQNVNSLFSLTGPQVSGSLVLSGQYLTLGINPDGSFITSDLSAGIEYQHNEFVIPGTPLAGFTIASNGSDYTNAGAAGTTTIPVTLYNVSSGDFHGVRIVGQVGGGLQLVRVVGFHDGDQYATIATQLTNTGGTTLNNVAWLENLDPDQGQPLGAPTGFATYNDVVLNGELVTATAYPSAYPNGLTIGLGSNDPHHAVGAQGFFNTDPYQIINNPQDPNGALDDIAINAAINFGTLAPSQSVSSSVVMTFGGSPAAADQNYLLGRSGESDFYKITATDSAPIQAATQTPAGLSGQFVNNLDPVLRLYDAAGHLVASNDNGAPDGRNALLQYKVPAGKGGTYYIEVAASGATAQPTAGEYILSVKGATGALPPFQVTGTLPTNGAVLTTPPSQITTDFNQSVLLPTLQASDLQVDGVGTTAVTTPDGETAVFSTPSAFQWTTASGGNGHYYVLTSSAETWTAAEAEAVALGGHLVSVNSLAEENFLIQRFMTRGNTQTIYWNGLNDQATEGTFVWTTGEPVTYTDWHAGEPNDYPGVGTHNEDYAAMNWYLGVGAAGLESRGDWNDTTANDYGRLHYGIIELSTLPAGDWLATDGSHTVKIAAGAIKDVSGTGITGYNGTFTLDLTPPHIVSSSLQENQVVNFSGSLTTNLSYTVGFSEAMNTAIVDSSAFTLYGNDRGGFYSPADFSWSADGKSLTLNYTDLPDDAYTLTLSSGALQDLVGWKLDGERPTGTISAANPSGDGVEGGDFTLDFVTHFTSAPYPGPLTPKLPLGSLVYDPSVTAVIGAAGLTDNLTFNLYAGQTITVAVYPQTGSLQPAVTVSDPGGIVLGSATAAAAGSDAILETVTAGSTGLYTFTVGGAGGTTGLFTAVLTLNSALQLPGNQSAGAAQNLSSSFVSLPKGASRGAVEGTFTGSGDYYSFHLNAGDTVSLGLELAAAGGAETFGYPSFWYSGTYYGISIAAGDVNGDHKQDLVVLNNNFYPSVSILLGNGDGTFTFAGSYFVGGFGGETVTLADLRGTGRPDIIVTTYYDDFESTGGLSVLLNNGDGTFGAPTDYSTGGYYASAVAVGDVTGDHVPDVVVTNYYGFSVSVFPGTGTGALGARTDYFAGYYPQGVALADLQGTGKADIVVGNYYDNSFSSGGVSVLLNDGSGAFPTQTSYLTGGYGTAGVAVADLGNGHLDLVTANLYGFNVSVLPGDGSGAFGGRTDYPTDAYPFSVAVADLDGDGHPDVVTGNYYSTASVLLGNGDGTLGGHTDYYNGYGHFSSQDLAVADFNGDGLPDLATPNYYDYSVSVLQNTTSRIGVQLLAPDGTTVLATGTGGAGNVDSAIHNFQVSADGTYYALISGIGSRGYQLVVTRQADFDTKNNGSPAQAQNISGTAGVLGYLDASSGSAEEWFAVQLTGGLTYSFPTSTPAVGGPGLYTNGLIPHIELYDASGSILLASGVKLADGRNETITFTPTASGIYLIRITSQGGTSGEFFLDPASEKVVTAAHTPSVHPAPTFRGATVSEVLPPLISPAAPPPPTPSTVPTASAVSAPVISWSPFMFSAFDSIPTPERAGVDQESSSAPLDDGLPTDDSLPASPEVSADSYAPAVPLPEATDLCFADEEWVSGLGQGRGPLSFVSDDDVPGDGTTAAVVTVLALALGGCGGPRIDRRGPRRLGNLAR